MCSSFHELDVGCQIGTIPMKLLYHLTTVFQPGGLRSRDGSVGYKDLLKNCKVPVMAIAGDRDMICPPDAVVGKVLNVIVAVLHLVH